MPASLETHILRNDSRTTLYISPMERAQAYKMKLEALKHQGKRVDLVDKSTSRQVGEKSWAVAKVGADANESERQVHRYMGIAHSAAAPDAHDGAALLPRIPGDHIVDVHIVPCIL